MWTRYHLKCDNCNNVTNLRVQIPEKEVLPIRFSCGYCSSEIRANIIVDFEHIKYSIEVDSAPALIKALEAVKQAVEAGELDTQINNASVNVRKVFDK